MFVGKIVSITHSGDHSISIRDSKGECVAVRRIPGKDKRRFDIELSDTRRIGVTVESMTPTFVEGSLDRGLRRIEIIP